MVIRKNPDRKGSIINLNQKEIESKHFMSLKLNPTWEDFVSDFSFLP